MNYLIRVTQAVHGQQILINSQTLPQIDANTNRFQTGQGYTYDADGNLIQDSNGRQFIFNGDNKQTEVKDASNNPVGRYYYDGNGKRVKKVTNTETVIFVYDGMGKLAAEYSTATPTSNPTTNYTATDPLGSPRVITNKQGQIISRRDFMPFGEEVTSDATYRKADLKYGSNDNIRQKFTGYQRDEESGLDFAEARYYNNAHGRFTAVDPLLASGKSANPQSFNRYAYTMNNPINLVDPSGLISQSTGADGGKNSKSLDWDTLCDFACRMREGMLNKQDIALAQFHVSNGTALGYSYLNAVQSRQNGNNTENFTSGTVDGVNVGDFQVTLRRSDINKLNKFAKNAKKRGQKEKSLFNTARQEIIDNIYSVLSTSADNEVVGLAKEFLISLIEGKLDKVIQIGRFIPEMVELDFSAEFVVGAKATIKVTDRVKGYNSLLAQTNNEIDENRNNFISSTFDEGVSLKITLSPSVMAMSGNKFSSITVNRTLEKGLWNTIFNRRVESKRAESYK